VGDRAVSLLDMEALAARTPGVRAAKAAWGWGEGVQRAVVLLHFVGVATLAPDVESQVDGAADPCVEVTAAAAVPIAPTLEVTIQVDPRRVAEDVVAEVRDLLLARGDGLLSPERLGVGPWIVQSRVVAAIEDVEGVEAVNALSWSFGAASSRVKQTEVGVILDEGTWLDLEGGTLVVTAGGRRA
jgi:hypothetical protein